MVKQTVINGTFAGDGTGENLFDSFNKVNNNFTEVYDMSGLPVPIEPGTYTGDVIVTSVVTGQSMAIPPGSAKLRVYNAGPGIHAMLALGTSIANAEAAAVAGMRIPAGDSAVLVLPATATHVAYVAGVDTITLNLTWGV